MINLLKVYSHSIIMQFNTNLDFPSQILEQFLYISYAFLRIYIQLEYHCHYAAIWHHLTMSFIFRANACILNKQTKEKVNEVSKICMCRPP